MAGPMRLRRKTPLERAVRRLFDHRPNRHTGFVTMLTARDVQKLLYTAELADLSESEAVAQIETTLEDMERRGLLRSKMIAFGPSVTPRVQRVYVWAAATRHPDHQKARESAPRLAAELERLATEGEALLRRTKADD